jgi:hypothetical protein
MREDAGTCAFCGQPLDGHDLNFRLRFPDAVAEALDTGFDMEELGGDPEHDTVIGIEGTWFLRVLLQVRLTDGCGVTFGTWLEVTPDTLDRVAEVWSTPAYGDLVVSGRLANAVPPWGGEVLGATATATVLEMEHSPSITTSDDPTLARVLGQTWPADVVLAPLPH